MILAMKKPQVEPGAFSYIFALLLFPGIESINIMEKILKTGIKKGLPAFYIIGAEGGSRTPTGFCPHDPESCASAYSATSAQQVYNKT